MIRRLTLAAALLLASCLATGCAAVTVSGNVGYLMLIPVLVDDGGQMNSAGTTYSDSHWFADPDSHPAVRPAPKSAKPAASDPAPVR